MFRECATAAVLATVCPACSLIVDFDQPLPADAAIDAVYTKAECEFGEGNNTFAEAAAVTSADTGPAAICAGGDEDHDFYSFEVTGSPTTIAIAFTQRPGGDLDMKLYNSMGTMIASSREFGATEMLTCPGTSPACPTLNVGETYTFEVFPGIANAVNSYTFSIAP
jgi:hypothetical protein